MNKPKNRLDALEGNFREFQVVGVIYQKAADRVANLAFTVVTASAAVIVLAPAVKVLAEYVTRLP